MKRLLLSAIGGVLIPLALVAPLFLLESCCLSVLERLGEISWLEPLAGIYFGLFLFPFLLLAPLQPESGSPDPNAPMIRDMILVAAILIDFVVYSALTYAILTWRARRKARV